MRVISICSLKGGVGKTTSAVFLAAVSAQHRGFRTRIVDADSQGSAADWIDTSPIDGVQIVEAPTVRALRRASTTELASDEIVIIDTPPADSPAGIIEVALDLADVVIVPMRPGALEPPRVMATLELIPKETPFGLILVGAGKTSNTTETLAAWRSVDIPVWGAIPLRAQVEAGPCTSHLNLSAVRAYEAIFDLALDAIVGQSEPLETTNSQ